MSLDKETRTRLAHAWLDDARMEQASVPAFLRLAKELQALGAPTDLIAAAVDAAGDEQRHADACLALARLYRGGDARLSQPRTPQRQAFRARLAIEALRDGCLGEAFAADLARAGAASAEVGPVASTLNQIAIDEERHANLSWRVLEWTHQTGRWPTRLAIRLAASWLPLLVTRKIGAAPEVLKCHGRPDPRVQRRLWRGRKAEVRGRVRLLRRRVVRLLENG